MNNGDQKLQELLKHAIPPAEVELDRDLWARMLRRMEAPTAAVPWFDWALIAALIFGLLLSPHTIPVLLYHL
jgi:hypothetical protein